MAFPTSVVSNTDPTSGNTQNNPDHAALHSSHNAEIAATETKIGTGASTPTSGKVLRATGTGTSAWGQVVFSTDVTTASSADLRGLLSDETGTGAAVFGTSPTIATPIITSPAITTPSITTSINDANGNEVIKTPATASAVNEFTVTNAATGTNPVLSATGNDSVISPNIRGKGTAGKVTIGAGATQIFPYDYVVSGCIITADSAGVNKNYSVSSGVVVINGVPLTVAAVSAQTVTASKDRYVDATDNGDGTAVLSTTAGEVNNNAASFALPANSIRIGIVVAGATTIANAASINQGQETSILPIASSIAYSVTDSLGNLICPRDPNRKILGYAQIVATSNTATSGAAVDITGLSTAVIVPAGRKIKITVYSARIQSSQTAGNGVHLYAREGSTVLAEAIHVTPVTNYSEQLVVSCIISPTTGSHTYKATYAQDAAGTLQITFSTPAIAAYILVELE